MGLEDFVPEESGEQGPASAEIAEKIKEGIKKGVAGGKRVKKDEKKAKRYDMSLASFLVKILLEKKYDSLFGSMFGSIHAGVPSNFVMGILSLIYPDVSDYIREKTKKEPIVFHYRSEETLHFSDSHLPDELKQRINEWIDDIVDILRFDPSSLMIEKIKECVRENNEIYIFGKQVLVYFLSETNIYIKDRKAEDYVDFIFKEVIYKKIEEKAFLESLNTI